MSPQALRTIGLGTALIGVIIDQAHKMFMIYGLKIAELGRIAFAPHLDLVMVWNRGVSYGFLANDAEIGRWLLALIGFAGAGFFTWWLWRADRLLMTLSLGLIIAGAVSNAIDRVVYGAVADFFLFYVGSFQWYVFNLADVWIVAGVIGMFLSWVVDRPEKATEC